MRTLGTAAQNPIVPDSVELVYGVIAFAAFLIPIVIVAFIIRQVVVTRRAAERAADAAERVSNSE